MTEVPAPSHAVLSRDSSPSIPYGGFEGRRLETIFKEGAPIIQFKRTRIFPSERTDFYALVFFLLAAAGVDQLCVGSPPGVDCTEIWRATPSTWYLSLLDQLCLHYIKLQLSEDRREDDHARKGLEDEHLTRKMGIRFDSERVRA